MARVILLCVVLLLCLGCPRPPPVFAPPVRPLETRLVDVLALDPAQLPQVPGTDRELDPQTCWLLAQQAHSVALAVEASPEPDIQRLVAAHLLAGELVEWTGDGPRPGFLAEIAGAAVSLHHLRVAQLVRAHPVETPPALAERFVFHVPWMDDNPAAADDKPVLARMREPAAGTMPRTLAWRAHRSAMALEARLAARTPSPRRLARLFDLHGQASLRFGEPAQDLPPALFAVGDRELVSLHDLRNAQLLHSAPALAAQPLDPALRARAERYLPELERDAGYADPALVLSLLSR